MIKTKLAGIELGADFTFFAVIAMFIALDTTGFALMSLCVCLIHEAGHLLAMLCTGSKPSSLIFRGGGIRIVTDKFDSVPVLLAGSAVNLTLFLCLYFTLPETDIYPIMFAVLNLVIGLFNLLPVGCLDGSKLLSIFVSEKALRVIELIVSVPVVCLVIWAVVSGGVNFTIAGVMIYIIAVDFFGKV
jgi:Zn-dependent protease